MPCLRVCAVICLLLIVCVLAASAQQPVANVSVVPSMVKFSGAVADGSNKPLTGTVGVTFSLYKDSEGGAPLWMETQNVQADKAGHFSVMLGSTSSQGLPGDLFISGEARWLGVQAEGQAEQPRTLLLSVPYALKAADAQTLGGLPPSAFLLATRSTSPASTSSTDSSSSVSTAPPPNAAITGAGTANFLPLWDTNTDIVSSVLFQSGSGASAKIGINTSVPATTFDVKGSGTFRGVLSLPALSAATKIKGSSSQPLSLVASAFNSGNSTAQSEFFNWQAEPTGNNTPTPSATLNLLFGSGAVKPAETGLKVASNGQITFASGQAFPGAGTITGVTTGSGLTGGGSNGNVNLSLTDKCASGQTLQWNGSVWTCSTSAGVSSVGMSAPTTDFTVTGAPVTGSGTLGLSWNVAPTSLNTANAIVKRDASGGFSATALAASNPSGFGVFSQGQFGVYGAGIGNGIGVSGTGYYGVYGLPGVGGLGGVKGEASTGQVGILAYNNSTGDAFFAENQTGGYAGLFVGDVGVEGNVSKFGGSFKIDHPLDPANKYLYHSFVESPDMMNIYNGNVITDAQGSAVVPLPEWFETLNRDFRYQLTVMGQFAQAIVAREVTNHQFEIKTDKPNVKVSWQVTGIRQDAWANAHRIPVEELKPEADRGLYLTPELFGASKEKSIARAHHPEMQKTAQPIQGPTRNSVGSKTAD
jgi:hypothetical protein